jgi:putative tricarboxylic transport membrane protein
VLVYALLFDKLGFTIATALMTVPVARFFGGSWKQSHRRRHRPGRGHVLLLRPLLDVVLPTGLWLNGILG